MISQKTILFIKRYTISRSNQTVICKAVKALIRGNDQMIQKRYIKQFCTDELYSCNGSILDFSLN